MFNIFTSNLDLLLLTVLTKYYAILLYLAVFIQFTEHEVTKDCTNTNDCTNLIPVISGVQKEKSYACESFYNRR